MYSVIVIKLTISLSWQIFKNKNVKNKNVTRSTLSVVTFFPISINILYYSLTSSNTVEWKSMIYRINFSKFIIQIIYLLCYCLLNYFQIKIKLHRVLNGGAVLNGRQNEARINSRFYSWTTDRWKDRCCHRAAIPRVERVSWTGGFRTLKRIFSPLDCARGVKPRANPSPMRASCQRSRTLVPAGSSFNNRPKLCSVAYETTQNNRVRVEEESARSRVRRAMKTLCREWYYTSKNRSVKPLNEGRIIVWIVECNGFQGFIINEMRLCGFYATCEVTSFWYYTIFLVSYGAKIVESQSKCLWLAVKYCCNRDTISWFLNR